MNYKIKMKNTVKATTKGQTNFLLKICKWQCLTLKGITPKAIKPKKQRAPQGKMSECLSPTLSLERKSLWVKPQLMLPSGVNIIGHSPPLLPSELPGNSSLLSLSFFAICLLWLGVSTMHLWPVWSPPKSSSSQTLAFLIPKSGVVYSNLDF